MAASRFSPEGLVIGFGLFGFGTIALLSEFGYVDLLTGVRLTWPLLLVFWGIAELVRTYTSRRPS
jgi:hypothetical protein